MSQLLETHIVLCPYHLAQGYLSDSVGARAASGEQGVLTLTAPGPGMELSKTVIVTFGSAVDPMHFDQPWRIHWKRGPGHIQSSRVNSPCTRTRRTKRRGWSCVDHIGPQGVSQGRHSTLWREGGSQALPLKRCFAASEMKWRRATNTTNKPSGIQPHPKRRSKPPSDGGVRCYPLAG